MILLSAWYTEHMTPKPLTPDQTEALHAAGDQPLPVVDPTTNTLYVLVDQKTHEQAMQALEEQRSHASIRAGIADMEAGRTMSIEEARQRTEQVIRANAKR